MDRAAADSPGAFAAWVVVGAGLCLGVLSMLTIGPFVLLATFVLTGFLLWRPGFGNAMAGLVTGAAVPLLWLAWLNRGGPGPVCTRSAGRVSCTDEWAPWPFLVVGAVLVVGGVVLFTRLVRR